jgi:maleate isomerase
MEPNFYEMAPKGVTIHSARMRLIDFTQRDLLGMLDDVGRETELLASAGVDNIVYGCSTCSLVGGIDWENVLVQQIEFDTGISVITVNQAVVEALRRLEGGNISVVTPYGYDLNKLEKAYLVAHGLDVISCKGMGLHDPRDICFVKEDAILNLVEQVAENADILYISCTNLPVTHLIESIEALYGVPVVTSNQAAMWAALENISHEKVLGYGKLFTL